MQVSMLIWFLSPEVPPFLIFSSSKPVGNNAFIFWNLWLEMKNQLPLSHSYHPQEIVNVMYVQITSNILSFPQFYSIRRINLSLTKLLRNVST